MCVCVCVEWCACEVFCCCGACRLSPVPKSQPCSCTLLHVWDVAHSVCAHPRVSMQSRRSSHCHVALRDDFTLKPLFLVLTSKLWKWHSLGGGAATTCQAATRVGSVFKLHVAISFPVLARHRDTGNHCIGVSRFDVDVVVNPQNPIAVRRGIQILSNRSGAQNLARSRRFAPENSRPI